MVYNGLGKSITLTCILKSNYKMKGVKRNLGTQVSYCVLSSEGVSLDRLPVCV